MSSRMTSTSLNWARNFLQAGTGVFRRQLVPAVPFEPGPRLPLAQAEARIRAELGKDVRNGLA